jgi:hypothetical protein
MQQTTPAGSTSEKQDSACTEQDKDKCPAPADVKGKAMDSKPSSGG